MNTKQNTQKHLIQGNTALTPVIRTKTRKIGNTTFIVTSRMNDGKSRDLAATIARLIDNDKEISGETSKSDR